MNEVILVRCGQNCDGESLYRVTVDGKELTAMLTLRRPWTRCAWSRR